MMERNEQGRLRALCIKETRKRIRQNVQDDNLLIQCEASAKEIERAANSLTKRLRDWYELYNPEFSRKEKDHERFVSGICNSKDTKAQGSMGAEFKAEDMGSLREYAGSIQLMYKEKRQLESYLDKLAERSIPNLRAVCGSSVAAQLLAHTGSLKRLAEHTASTIQVLGAEKALFRHMRTGAKAPKHGLIFQHPMLQMAKTKDRGKIARALADKIAMAARIDYFKGDFAGDKLAASLKKRFSDEKLSHISA